MAAARPLGGRMATSSFTSHRMAKTESCTCEAWRKSWTPPRQGCCFKPSFVVDPRAHQYCVTGDGARFLLAEPVEEPKPITVVFNWAAGLEEVSANRPPATDFKR